MSGMLREREQWRVGLRDPTTRGSWREELLTADLDPPLLSSHVDYLLAELDWYAATREADTAIERSTAEGVWQSDSLLSLTCLSSLQKHVGALMESQAEARGGQSAALPQVRELVDPSLYPLTAGRTVVVADEQVSLERSLDMQGAGQVLTMKEFRRRAVAIPSDPERFAEEQKKQRAASQSLGPAQRAKEAKAKGKMLLHLQLAVKEVRGGPTVSRAGLCTVFVLPTSTIAEVKRLAQLTEEWKEGWQVGDATLPPRTVYLSTMYSDQQHALRDHRTLQSYDIHSNDPQHTTMLTLEALAVPQPPAARPAQFVYIELYSVSGALLCAVRADESETIAAIKQRLSAGGAEGEYPVTTGLPISEFRLLAMSRQHASRVHHLLGEERRLTEYGWYNVDHPKGPRKYSYGAHRVTFIHLPDGGVLEDAREKAALETAEGLRELRVTLLNFPTATFRVPPLAPSGTFTPADGSPSTYCVILSVPRDDTVAALKTRLSTLHPGYAMTAQHLPVTSQHLFFPLQGSGEGAELRDSQSLAELNVGADDAVGLRWDWTEAEAEAQTRACERRTAVLAKSTAAAPSFSAFGVGGFSPSGFSTKSAPTSSLVGSPQRPPPPQADGAHDSEQWLHALPDLSEWNARISTDLTKPDAVIVHMGGKTDQQWKLLLTLGASLQQVREAIASGEGEAPKRMKDTVKGVHVSRYRISLSPYSTVGGVVGIELHDHLPLSWYCNSHDGTIYLHWASTKKGAPQPPLPGGRIQLKIASLAEHSVGLLPSIRYAEVDAEMTVGALKDQFSLGQCDIHAETPLQTRHSPSPRPPILDSTRSLRECGFVDGSTVWVEGSFMDVTATLLPDEATKHIVRVVPRYLTIAELKGLLAALPGAPPLSHLGLRLQCSALGHSTVDLRLRDDLSLRQVMDQRGVNMYHSHVNPLIAWVFHTAQPLTPQNDWNAMRLWSGPQETLQQQGLVRLSVRFPETNDVFDLLAYRDEPIRVIRARVRSIPVTRHHELQLLLPFSPAVLLDDDRQTLADYGAHTAHVHLHVRPLSLSVVVTVCSTPTPHNAHVPCHPDETVATLKARVVDSFNRAVRPSPMVTTDLPPLSSDVTVITTEQLRLRFVARPGDVVADDTRLGDLLDLRPCCGPQGESHIRGTHSAGRGMHTPGRDPPFVQVLGGDSTLGSYQEAPHVLWGDSSVSSVTARAMEGLAGRSQYVDDMMKAASMHIKYPPQTSLRLSAD